MKRRGRPPLTVRPIKPLALRVVHRLARVMGTSALWTVEVNGLLGTADVLTTNRTVADMICRSLRRHVRKMTPQAQRKAFYDKQVIVDAEKEPR